MAAGLVALAGAAGTARADAKTDKAKEHWARGVALYDDARYADAVEEFEAGYALTLRAPFLVNIAQCWRMLGETDKAIRYYERYLETEREGPTADEARKVLADLRRTKTGRTGARAGRDTGGGDDGDRGGGARGDDGGRRGPSSGGADRRDDAAASAEGADRGADGGAGGGADAGEGDAGADAGRRRGGLRRTYDVRARRGPEFSPEVERSLRTELGDDYDPFVDSELTLDAFRRRKAGRTLLRWSLYTGLAGAGIAGFGAVYYVAAPDNASAGKAYMIIGACVGGVGAVFAVTGLVLFTAHERRPSFASARAGAGASAEAGEPAGPGGDSGASAFSGSAPTLRLVPALLPGGAALLLAGTF
jgi:hypothetical protein